MNDGKKGRMTRTLFAQRARTNGPVKSVDDGILDVEEQPLVHFAGQGHAAHEVGLDRVDRQKED